MSDKKQHAIMASYLHSDAGAVGEPRDNRNLLDLEKLFPEGDGDGFGAVDGT